jgi:glycine/D-amino acid oxidase-like deaminating enzyme
LFSGLANELETDIEWVQGGCLLLARDEEAASEYESWYRIAKYAELDTEVVTVKQAKALIPDLKASFLMALHNPANGHANPLKATLAFAKGAVRAGAQIITGLTVNRIVTSGGRVVGVDTSAGHVRCSTVVCAAGRWTPRLLRGIGVDMPQTVAEVPVIMTKPLPPLTNKMVWSKHLCIRQMPSGSVVIGSVDYGEVVLTPDHFRHMRMFLPLARKYKDVSRVRIGKETLHWFNPKMRKSWRAPDPPIPTKWVAQKLEALARWVPDLPGIQPEKIWAGVADTTPDMLPVLDRLREPEGLVIATGFSGHGFSFGPIAGVVVADLITKGRYAEYDLHPMRLARFREKDFALPQEVGS